MKVFCRSTVSLSRYIIFLALCFLCISEFFVEGGIFVREYALKVALASMSIRCCKVGVAR